jgi:hypothetical protein
VYSVAEGTPEDDARRLILERFDHVRGALDPGRQGKMINLAVFDHIFHGRPQRRPVVTLTWKDWKGADPEIRFPQREAGDPNAPTSARSMPTPTPAPASFPAPKPAPVEPEPAKAEPAKAEPVKEPAKVEPAKAEPPKAAQAPEPAKPAAFPAPTKAAEPAKAAAPPPVKVEAPKAAPVAKSEPAPTKAEPAKIEPAKPEPVKAEPPKAAPVPEPAKPEPAKPAAAKPAVVPKAEPAAAPVAVPKAPPAPKKRLTGDDLLAEMFEAFGDLAFARDSLEGAEFVLNLTLEKLPAQVGLVSLFDMNTREFVVVRQSGGPRSALCARQPEKAALAQSAMRRRHAIVVSDPEGAARAMDDRWRAIGVELTSLVCAPIELSGRYLGLLELANPMDGQAFNEGDGNALTYIGQQFAEFVAARGVIVDPAQIRGEETKPTDPPALASSASAPTSGPRSASKPAPPQPVSSKKGR